MAIRVVVEVAPKRSFASALDWPGWSRGGRTEDDALVALLAYVPRYAPVADRAGALFGPPATVRGLDLVERLRGDGSTEFGVPHAPAAAEEETPSAKEVERLVALLRAAWDTFDDAATAAGGVELRKGPRGGGRDLAKIVEHVRGAEDAYLGQLGSRLPPMPDDPARAMTTVRDAFVATFEARIRGAGLPNPRNTKRPWPPRYAVRRSAWHSLDHAWELEDRSG